MNSNKVIVSGKNATISVFINCSQSQKEEAERLEYEIKNSCTSTEEEDDDTSTFYTGDSDICDICDEIMPNNCYCKCNKCNDFLNDGCKCNKEEADFKNEQDEIKHLEEVEVLKNALDKKDEEIKKLDEENTKLLSENEDAKQREKGDQELIDELEDKVNTLELNIKALKFQLTEKHQQWKYEGMKKDLKHFTDLNSERWEEIQTLKVSVTNHEKQSKINESELIWYKNKCKSLSDENFKEKEMRVEANKYDTKIYNKLEKELKEAKEEIEELKGELNGRDRVIGKIQSNMFTLEKELKEQKEKEEEDFKEHNKRFWKHKEEIEYLKKENKELDDRLTIILEHKDNLLKELRELRATKRELKAIKNNIFSRCGGCCETIDNCICYIEGDEQINDDIYHVKGQIEELRNRSHFDFPITGYGIEPKLIQRWRSIHFNDAHQEAKNILIKKEQDKYNKLIEENKQYKIKVRNQLKAEKALKNVDI